MEKAPTSLAPEEPAACATCGAALDGLRAPWAALYEQGLLVFCSRRCWSEREAPTSERRASPAPTPVTEPSPPALEPPQEAGPLVALAHGLGLHSPSLPPELRPTAVPEEPAQEAPEGAPSEPPTPSRGVPASAPSSAKGTREAGVLALAGSVLCTAAVAGLSHLASPGLGLTLLGFALGVGPLVASARSLRWLLRVGTSFWLLLPPLGSLGALLVLAVAEQGAARLARLAAAMAEATALVAAATHVRARWLEARAVLREARGALPETARRLEGSREVVVESLALHVGDRVLLEAGDVLPSDGEVLEGDAELEPRVRGRSARRVGPGDAVLASATVRSGRLVVRVSVRPLDSAQARLARLGPAELLASASQLRVERAARSLAGAGLGLTVVVTAVHLLSGGEAAYVAAMALGVMPSCLLAALAPTLWLDAAGRALSRGVLFGDAAAMQAASAARTVVLCTRGTLSAGRFEVTEVVSLGERKERELLSWAAGLEEHAGAHPVAKAVLAAARARGVEPRVLRRVVLREGRGVVASDASGAAVVLGSRALLLAEGVSIAAAESVCESLEAQGRVALLLAVAGRVEGVLGLLDAPRPEALPTVQSLVDEGLDVVLLGGESRGTLEALAQQLDVQGTRPEVPPEERAEVVQRLSEVAGPVAVVGRAAVDARALGAADVAVVLDSGAAGAATVRVTEEDLRAAGEALVLARRLRRSLVSMRWALQVGGLGATLVVGFVPAVGAWGLLAMAALLHGAAVFAWRRGATSRAPSA